jgi:hypothetical protein
MTVNRYTISNGRLMQTSDGFLVDYGAFDRLKAEHDKLKEQVRLLKPSEQHMYLVQWWIGPHDPDVLEKHRTSSIIMAVKHYDALQDFLSDLAENSSIIDIRVSALQPVTTKKVLTVEL